MTLADLDTGVRYGLPLVVVVSNDGAFSSDVHFLQWAGYPDEIARVAPVSFAEVAAALGADAVTVESIDDLSKVTGLVANLQRPLVVDCRVTSDVRPEVTDWFLAGRYPTGAASPP
jgi:acetolactate synthase I/II/III large subunit